MVQADNLERFCTPSVQSVRRPGNRDRDKILKYGSYPIWFCLFVCLPKLKCSNDCFYIFRIRKLGWVASKQLIISFCDSLISKDKILISVGEEVLLSKMTFFGTEPNP